MTIKSRTNYRLTRKERERILIWTFEGVSQKEQARRLRCNVNSVVHCQAGWGATRWQMLTPRLERQIVAHLRQGHGTYKTAKKFRVPQPAVGLLMHKNGIVHPFPHRHSDAPAERTVSADRFVELVTRVAEKCFAGKLPEPEHDTRLIAAMLTCFVPQDVPAEYRGIFSTAELDRVRDHYAAGFVQAIDCLRRQRAACWQN